MICEPCKTPAGHVNCAGYDACPCLHRVGQQIVAKPMTPMPKGIKYA